MRDWYGIHYIILARHAGEAHAPSARNEQREERSRAPGRLSEGVTRVIGNRDRYLSEDIMAAGTSDLPDSDRHGASSPRVGFIGLGNMGWPMAANVAAAGLALRVHNRT